MTLTWTTGTHPTGRRYWTAGEYRIESTGWHTVSTKTGADRGRRIGGGYQVEIGRRRIGLPSSTIAEAKARAERHAEQNPDTC